MKHRSPSLFKSLVQSLILHGTIETSEAKAKAIKGLVDKIINLAKNHGSSNKNRSNKDLQERLIKDVLPKLESRTSGYTSLLKLGPRVGDNTRIVRMSLIGVAPVKKAVSKKVASKKSAKRKISK